MNPTTHLFLLFFISCTQEDSQNSIKNSDIPDKTETKKPRIQTKEVKQPRYFPRKSNLPCRAQNVCRNMFELLSVDELFTKKDVKKTKIAWDFAYNETGTQLIASHLAAVKPTPDDVSKWDFQYKWSTVREKTIVSIQHINDRGIDNSQYILTKKKIEYKSERSENNYSIAWDAKSSIQTVPNSPKEQYQFRYYYPQKPVSYFSQQSPFLIGLDLIRGQQKETMIVDGKEERMLEFRFLNDRLDKMVDPVLPFDCYYQFEYSCQE